MEMTGAIHSAEHALHEATMRDYREDVVTIFQKTARFVLHFLEMCIVMCLSLEIFTRLAVAAGALIGYSGAVRQFPVLSTGLLSAWFTLIIIGWMRLRGHEWHMTLEMASASLFAAVPLIGGALLGFISSAGLTGAECGLACVFMVVAMLVRLDHYTDNHANHQGHVHATQVEV